MANPDTTSERQRVGGDVYLTPPGSTSGPRVDVGFAVPDWKAATKKNLRQAAFPGTAVLAGDRWCEIHRIAPLDDAPHRTAYHLRPWDDAAVIRTAFELTPAACEALTRDHHEQQRRRGQGNVLSLFPFLTGMLPAADQQRLEAEAGVPAVRATMISACIMLAPSVTILMMQLALSLGMSFGELAREIASFWLLAWYLAIESIARISSASGNEPMGSLPVGLPIYVLRALRGIEVSEERIQEKRAARSSPAPLRTDLPAGGMLAARDEVHPLDHPECDLEVVSRLPKDHWTLGVTGIEYQGEAYILVERKMLETGDGPRHHFLLQKPDRDVLFNSYLRYEPEEVRDIYRAQQRTKTATWVETFPFLWSLTSGPTQMRLARQFNYNPDKWIRWNIFVCAMLGAVVGYYNGKATMALDAGAGDALGATAGFILLSEQAVRWSKVRAGELPGSLLGVPLERLARRCLRWE